MYAGRVEAFADEELEGEVREIDTRPLLAQPLDILGFDSCVMGMLEVGYQFSDVAHVLIASEERAKRRLDLRKDSRLSSCGR